MQTKKMSLSTIQGKLSRAEMKKIMAGSAVCKFCSSDYNCDSFHVCRSSPSCIEIKVCALPYLV